MERAVTDKIKSKSNYIALAVLLIIGIGIALLSPKQAEEKHSEQSASFNENEYERELEARLKSLIEQIDGVGTVSVMITLEGSVVYSYAQDVTENVGSGGDVKRESNIVLSAKGTSVKEAVVSGYTMPKVKGAAVVCKNKLSASLLEKVIGTVSASLGISTDKIYVTN